MLFHLSLRQQFYDFFSTRLEKDKPTPEFVDRFEDQWNQVYEMMTSGPDFYCRMLKAFLEEYCTTYWPHSCRIARTRLVDY